MRMGNRLTYRIETTHLRRRLKEVEQTLAREKKLEAAIAAEQSDGYWSRKGAMSGEETRYIEALEELRPRLPALRTERDSLLRQMEQIKQRILAA